MAEIQIQKKKGPGPWVWMIGVFLIIGVIWVIAASTGPKAENVRSTDPGDTAATAAAPADARGVMAPAAVTEFVEFANSARPAEAGLDHDYVATGLRRLVEAIDAVATAGGTDAKVEGTLATLRAQADRVQKDPESVKHADTVRAAFRSAADAMHAVAASRFPGAASRVAPLREAAQTIAPEQPLLEQTTRVKEFFSRAGEALQEMT